MNVRLQARVLANFGEAVAAQIIEDDPTGDGLQSVRRKNNGSLDEPTIVKAVPLTRIPLLVAGDRIVCEGVSSDPHQDKQAAGDSTHISSLRVIELIERSSVLSRPDRKKQLKPLAANLTQLVIICAPNPPPDLLLIDQFCVQAGKENINALIVLNKADLTDQSADAITTTNICEIYRQAGFKALSMSTKTGEGFDQFCEALESNTSALVGQSGVGKSSIVSRLLPDQDIRVGNISKRTGLGAHTTTVSFLYSVGSNGSLIDSPGVRQFAVSHLPEKDIALGFPEIADLALNCRFNDCRHDKEPDCAVRAAIATTKINQGRFDNYCRLLDEVRLMQATRPN